MINYPVYPNDYEEKVGIPVDENTIDEWVEEGIDYLTADGNETVPYVSFSTGDTKVTITRGKSFDGREVFTVDVAVNVKTVEIDAL